MLTTGRGGGGGGGGGGAAGAAEAPPPPPPIIIIAIIIGIIESLELFLVARSLIELVICVSIVVSWSLAAPDRDVTRDAPPLTRPSSRALIEVNVSVLLGMERFLWGVKGAFRLRAVLMPARTAFSISYLRASSMQPSGDELHPAPLSSTAVAHHHDHREHHHHRAVGRVVLALQAVDARHHRLKRRRELRVVRALGPLPSAAQDVL